MASKRTGPCGMALSRKGEAGRWIDSQVKVINYHIRESYYGRSRCEQCGRGIEGGEPRYGIIMDGEQGNGRLEHREFAPICELCFNSLRNLVGEKERTNG
jgi:hypothetical protein